MAREQLDWTLHWTRLVIWVAMQACSASFITSSSTGHFHSIIGIEMGASEPVVARSILSSIDIIAPVRSVFIIVVFFELANKLETTRIQN